MFRVQRNAAAAKTLMRLSMAGATALCVTMSSAGAADLGRPLKMPPMAAPIFTWTGFYVGGSVGYGWGKDHLLEYFAATGAFTGFEKRYDLSGVVGGIYGGANYQIGGAVMGLEADFEGADIKGNWSDQPIGIGNTVINWQSSVRGRLGFAADKALFYGTGGLAIANVGHTYTNLITGINEPTSSVRTGWTAGGGIEMALTPNVLARVEYRYTDLGKSTYDSLTSFPGLRGTQEPKYSTIRIGAAYKF